MKTKTAIFLSALGALTAIGHSANAATVESFICTPVSVGVGENGLTNERAVVTCATAGKDTAGAAKIFFFAISTSNSARANRFLTTGIAAMTSGRRLSINYNHTTTVGGCATSNCRVPLDFGVQ